MDATHYKVRPEGAIVYKAAYIVTGIDLDGRKDVWGMWIGEHETSKFWLVVLKELRNRGVQDILIYCADNPRGFSLLSTGRNSEMHRASDQEFYQIRIVQGC